MHFNARALFLPVLFVTSGVVAQLAAEATSGTPAFTPPSYGDLFVFCSSADCTGTCESVVPYNEGDGEAAPNDMGFQSIYWYNPLDAGWVLYTCVDIYNCDSPPSIGSNTCYNLYDNGALTDFGWYWWLTGPTY